MWYGRISVCERSYGKLNLQVYFVGPGYALLPAYDLTGRGLY
jgi:hypothetical protein